MADWDVVSVEKAQPSLTQAPASAPAQDPWKPVNVEPAKGAGFASSLADRAAAPAEVVASALTGAFAMPVAGLAGLAQGAYNVGAEALGGQPGMPAAQRVQQVEQAATYQPRTQTGQLLGKIVGMPGEALTGISQKAGEATMRATGSPLAAAGVETAIAGAPALLPETMGRVSGVGRARAAPKITPESEALFSHEAETDVAATVNDYAKRNNIDLGAVGSSVRQALVDIAKTGTDLSKLDPRAIERQANLEKLGIPATRGQLTRNITQLTREETLSKSQAGEPIRNIKTAQDLRLGELIDTLRQETGAKAETREQIGKSAQSAGRAKVQALKKDYKAAYQNADYIASLQESADVAPLKQLLQDPSIRRYTDLPGLLKDYAAKPVETKIEKPQPRNMATPDPREDSILQWAAKHTKGMDFDSAVEEGFDPADLRGEKALLGIKRSFRKGGESLDRMAEILADKGYNVFDRTTGKPDKNVLLQRIDDELRGRPHYSERNIRQEDIARYNQEIRDRAEAGELPTTVSIGNLEKIRQALNKAPKGTEKSFYSNQAIAAIDNILDKVNVGAYKEARAKFKAFKDEFDRQGRVKKLISEKGMSSDRAVALEDTVDHILRSPAEDILKIKKSLNEGGTPATKAKGMQAWADIRGGVIDKLKEAANKSQIQGEAGQYQINSSFNGLFNELEKDGKIDAIFTPQQAVQLRRISKAIADVRTTPAARIAGSPTAANLAAKALDLLDRIPGVGQYGVGAAKAIYKGAKAVSELGKEGREVKKAITSPLAEETEIAKNGTKKQARRQTLKSLGEAAKPLAPYTLRDIEDKK